MNYENIKGPTVKGGKKNPAGAFVLVDYKMNVIKLVFN